MLNKVDGPAPADAVRVLAWRQIKSPQTAATFRVQTTGRDPFKVTIRGRRRQVLERLMNGPLYSSSLARVSDIVLALRGLGLEIRTDVHRADAEIGAERFGIYHLESRVTEVAK